MYRARASIQACARRDAGRRSEEGERIARDVLLRALRNVLRLPCGKHRTPARHQYRDS